MNLPRSKSLVRYAGFDPSERPLPTAKGRFEGWQELVRSLWRMGDDTRSIASQVGLPESVITNELAKYRGLRLVWSRA